MSYLERVELYLKNNSKIQELKTEIRELDCNFADPSEPIDLDGAKHFITDLLNSRLFTDLHIDDWVHRAELELFEILSDNRQLVLNEAITSDICHAGEVSVDSAITKIYFFPKTYEIWILCGIALAVLNFEEFVKWSRRTTAKSAENK